MPWSASSPSLSWAEALALQIRVRFARFAGGVIGPSLQPVRAMLEPMQEQLARVRNLVEARDGLAYCFCSSRIGAPGSSNARARIRPPR